MNKKYLKRRQHPPCQARTSCSVRACDGTRFPGCLVLPEFLRGKQVEHGQGRGLFLARPPWAHLAACFLGPEWSGSHPPGSLLRVCLPPAAPALGSCPQTRRPAWLSLPQTQSPPQGPARHRGAGRPGSGGTRAWGCSQPALCRLGRAELSSHTTGLWVDAPAPGPSQRPSTQTLGRAAPTFAVCDIGGAVEVGAGVARAGNAVVLSELGLVGAGRAADAPVGGGVVVVARGAVHWGGTGGEGWGTLPGPPVPEVPAQHSRPFPTAC